MPKEFVESFTEACDMAKRIAKFSGEEAIVRREGERWIVISDISHAEVISRLTAQALDDNYYEHQIDAEKLNKELDDQGARRQQEYQARLEERSDEYDTYYRL